MKQFNQAVMAILAIGMLAGTAAAQETEKPPALTAVRRAKRVLAFRAACGGDVKQLCAEVKPGDGRILACLRSNDGALSPTCKTRLARSTGKKALAETAGLADEALAAEQQNGERAPESVVVAEPVTEPVIEPVIEEPAVAEAPAVDPGAPAPTN